MDKRVQFARILSRFRQIIELHILPTLGKVKLLKLAPQQLQKLYRTKAEEGLASQTIKHIHRVLHRAFNDALRWGLVARNVCDAVDTPRVPMHEMQALTGEQAQRLLAAAQGDPLEALYVLALTTGMRQGELLALKWGDIDFLYGKLQVRRSIARVGKNGFQVSEPKSAKSNMLILVRTSGMQKDRNYTSLSFLVLIKSGYSKPTSFFSINFCWMFATAIPNDGIAWLMAWKTMCVLS